MQKRGILFLVVVVIVISFSLSVWSQASDEECDRYLGTFEDFQGYPEWREAIYRLMFLGDCYNLPDGSEFERDFLSGLADEKAQNPMQILEQNEEICRVAQAVDNQELLLRYNCNGLEFDPLNLLKEGGDPSIHWQNSCDDSWSQIGGRGNAHFVRDARHMEELPSSFRPFWDFYKSQSPKDAPWFRCVSDTKALYPRNTLAKRFRIFIAWMYVEENFTKTVEVSHDDNLGVATASCGDLKFESCTFEGPRDQYYHYRQDNEDGWSATFPLVKGWNVVAFFLDNDGGGGMKLSYEPQLKDENRILVMNGGGVPDADFDTVPDIFDQCPNTPEEDVELGVFDQWPEDIEVLVENAPEHFGCAQSEVEDKLDTTKELCRFDRFSGEDNAWLEGAQGGNMCCGNSPDDAGKVEKANGIQYLCLNNEQTKTANWQAPNDDELSGNEWTWMPATDAITKIFTITNQTDTFDVMADGFEWHSCNSDDTIGPLKGIPIAPAPGQDQDSWDEFYNQLHGFYCYKEGDHYSFAQCVQQDTPTVDPDPQNPDASGQDLDYKQRTSGDGLFSLQTPNKPYSRVTIGTQQYNDYYEGEFDFSGYDQMEMFVRFYKEDGEDEVVATQNDIREHPPSLFLEFHGPRDQNGDPGPVYLRKNILGDIISRPAFITPEEGENSDRPWIYIKTKIPDNLKFVDVVLIEPDSLHKIVISNLYLSKSSDDVALLCSGEVAGESNWIQSYDDGRKGRINSQNICKRHFGSDAWLGDDSVDNGINTDYGYANCCGNNADGTEYYVGPGLEHNACYDSVVLKSGQSVGDVEVDVSAINKSVRILDDPITFGYYFSGHIFDKSCFNGCDGNEVSLKPSQGKIKLAEFQMVKPYTQFCKQAQKTLPDGTVLFEPPRCVLNENELNSVDMSDYDSTYIINERAVFEDQRPDMNLGLNDQHQLGDKVDLFIYSDETKEEAHVTSLGDAWVIMDPTDRRRVNENAEFIELKGNGPHTLSIMAQTKKLDFEPINEPFSTTISTPCKSSTCIIPIPGEPTYTISNPHEQEYDLYFKNQTDKVKITGEMTFESYGILIAENVPQTIVYDNGFVEQEDVEENDELQAGEYNERFYSCNAQIPEKAQPFTDEANYCKAIGDMYCSPQSFNYDERTTIAGSWTNLGLHHAITEEKYDGDEAQDFDTPEDFLNFLVPAELEEGDGVNDIPRNQTAVALPTRNIIPNALFDTYDQQLPYWTILNGNAPVSRNSIRGYVDDSKVLLEPGFTLRSDKIIIPTLKEGQTLLFQDETNCPVTITTTDTQSNIGQQQKNQPFPATNLKHLTIEYQGACEVYKPYLQIVDAMGPLDTFNESAYQDPTDTSYAYAPMACCPSNYCWDGHSCVAPMQDATNVGAYVEEGRVYRCIAGEWSALPILWDWDNEEWGFCSAPKQCLVAKGKDATPGASSQSFMQGEIPGCINNGEYIMDNYCNQGEWTTRTSFVANALLDVAQGQEYTLQCGSVYEMLPLLRDQNNMKRYIYGDDASDATWDVLSRGDDSPAPPVNGLCFPQIQEEVRGDEGSKFITNQENTCVNNICVLKLHREDGDITIMGTSLNKKLSDPNSFAAALSDLEPEVAQAACQSDQEGFVECDLPGRDDILLYENNISAIIYAKEDFDGNVLSRALDAVIEFFSSLFGDESELDVNPDFLQDAQKFDQVYLLYKDNKQVRGVLEESTGNSSRAMVVEYQGFETNICDYLDTEKWKNEPGCGTLPNAAKPEVSCVRDADLQRYQATCAFDLWSQVTGRLRVSESEE